MSEIDEQERAAEQRRADALAAERDLLEQLAHRGMTEVWMHVRAGLHCERFLESRTGKLVTERLMKTIVDAQMNWLLSDDPGAPEVANWHRNAQAAHLALYALDEVIQDGKQAAIDLERINVELGDE